MIWGNEADVLMVSKEESKGHQFMWSKGMLKWTANGGRTGFLPARRKSIKSLWDGTKCTYSPVTYNLEKTGLASDNSEEYARFPMGTQLFFYRLSLCCVLVVTTHVTHLWLAYHWCLWFSSLHPMAGTWCPCVLWLVSLWPLKRVPSRGLYCNTFTPLCN